MSDEKLNNLGILALKRQRAEVLNMNEAIDKFAAAKNQRIVFF